jgi:uncharacterized protein YndB with AHSA1/START domain
MSRLEATVEISKTPHQVFAYVIDPMHTPQWMHAVLAVSSLSSDPVEVGSTFHHCWQLLDHLLETTYEVLECEPGRTFTYQSIVSFELDALEWTGKHAWRHLHDPLRPRSSLWRA